MAIFESIELEADEHHRDEKTEQTVVEKLSLKIKFSNIFDIFIHFLIFSESKLLFRELMVLNYNI